MKVQEDFKDLGGDTLDKLDVYIAHCDAVVHLVGDMCGAPADERQQQALLAKHSDLPGKLPPLGDALKNCVCLPYTQWEAWLALYHGRSLLIAKAKTTAPRGPRFAPDDASRAAQAEHLKWLKTFHRYPGSEFGSPEELAKQIAYTAILDLLVENYAEKFVEQRDVAEGFIAEMSKRVARDKALDLDGMMQAVRNAIEIYEKEIAGRPIETNLDDIVGRALARAKARWSPADRQPSPGGSRHDSSLGCHRRHCAHPRGRACRVIGAIMGLVTLLLALVLGTIVGSGLFLLRHAAVRASGALGAGDPGRRGAGPIWARSEAFARQVESKPREQPQDFLGRRRRRSSRAECLKGDGHGAGVQGRASVARREDAGAEGRGRFGGGPFRPDRTDPAPDVLTARQSVPQAAPDRRGVLVVLPVLRLWPDVADELHNGRRPGVRRARRGKRHLPDP